MFLYVLDMQAKTVPRMQWNDTRSVANLINGKLVGQIVLQQLDVAVAT